MKKLSTDVVIGSASARDHQAFLSECRKSLSAAGSEIGYGRRKTSLRSKARIPRRPIFNIKPVEHLSVKERKERDRKLATAENGWKSRIYNDCTKPEYARDGFSEATPLVNRDEAVKTYNLVNRVSKRLNDNTHRENARIKQVWRLQRARARRRKAAEELAAADPYNFMTWWEKEKYWEDKRKLGHAKTRRKRQGLGGYSDEEEDNASDSDIDDNRKHQQNQSRSIQEKKIEPYEVMLKRMLSRIADIMGHPINVYRMPIEEVKFELLARDVELSGSEHDLRMKLDDLLDTRNCLYTVDTSSLSIEEVEEQLEARGHNLMGNEERKRRKLGGALVKELPRAEFENYPKTNVFKIPIEEVVFELRNRALEIRGPPDALRIRLKKVLAEERRQEDRVTPIDVSLLSDNEVLEQLDKRQLSVQGTTEMLRHRIGLRLAVEEANKEERVNIIHHQLTEALVALKTAKGSKRRIREALDMVKACVWPFAVLAEAEGLRKWISDKKLAKRLKSVAETTAIDWRKRKRAMQQEATWRRAVTVRERAIADAGESYFATLEAQLKEARDARHASADDAIESKQWVAKAAIQAFAACEYANYCAEKACATAARAHEIAAEAAAEYRRYKAHLKAVSDRINAGLDRRRAENNDFLQGVQIRCRAAEINKLKKAAEPVKEKMESLPDLIYVDRPKTPRRIKKEIPKDDEAMIERRKRRKALKKERERKRAIRDAQKAEQLKRQLIEREKTKAIERANMSGFSKKKADLNNSETAEQRAERQVRERRAKLKARKKESKRRKQIAMQQMEEKAKEKAKQRAQSLEQTSASDKERKPGTKFVTKLGPPPSPSASKRVQ
eukprot:g5045.t1